MTSPEEQQLHIPHKEEPIRFVEELANEHDYWLSLTDAARITRTSEAMARRWVSSGRLPVKKELVGVNQRTRLVRASDVARLRPIIDPTAAITDDIHKLDLLSIPREHLRLLQVHQILQTAVHELQAEGRQQMKTTYVALEQLTMMVQSQGELWEHQFTDVQKEFHQTAEQQQRQYEAVVEQGVAHTQDIERMTAKSREQERLHQQNMERLRDVVQDSFLNLQTTVQEMRNDVEQQFAKRDQDDQLQREQMQHTFTSLLQQQQEHVTRVLTEREEILVQQTQGQKRLQHDLSTVQHTLMNTQETFTALFQQVGEVKIGFEHILSELASMRTAWNEHVEAWEARLEQIAAQVEAADNGTSTYQERVETQNRLIETLTKRLQDEISNRQVLGEQVAVQQKHLQALSHELAGLKQQRTKE